MMNDISIDKILQRQENGNLFIVHVIATGDMLTIQIEDKMKGDIWVGQFSLQQIEEITLKAKNPKKFAVFIKMLMSSLLGQTQSVLIQILTYSQLQRKMNLASRGRNIQNNKKYLIMTYMSQFDKAHYPLALNYLDNPPVERLRITIRRLAQQLIINEGDRGQSFQAKQFSMVKYENQTLKARIKNLQQKLQVFSNDGQNVMNKSNIRNQNKNQLEQLRSIMTAKDQQIEQLKAKVKQLTVQNDKKQNLIIDLKQQIAQYKEQRVDKKQQQQTYSLLEQKINQMNKQTREMVSQLQFAKQKQKKNLLKIENLQKQLQKMMALQQKKRIGGVNPKISSNLQISRKSVSVKSEKSFTSQKSQKSNKSNLSKSKGGFQTYLSKPAINNANNTKKPVTKRSSLYDSDTESSKLRKGNNSRVSPYRQASKPTGNVSNSSKRASNNFTSSMNRFDRNILANSRDRSRSKSVKKQNSPPAQIPTDNFASSSDDDRNITQALTKLKERKNRVKMNQGKDKNQNQRSSRNAMGPIQRKITDIAQMLRKAKSRQGRD